MDRIYTERRDTVPTSHIHIDWCLRVSVNTNRSVQKYEQSQCAVILYCYEKTQNDHEKHFERLYTFDKPWPHPIRLIGQIHETRKRGHCDSQIAIDLVPNVHAKLSMYWLVDIKLIAFYPINHLYALHRDHAMSFRRPIVVMDPYLLQFVTFNRHSRVRTKSSWSW